MTVKIKLPLILNCDDTLRIHPSTSLLQPSNSVHTYVSDNHMMTFAMELLTQVRYCWRGMEQQVEWGHPVSTVQEHGGQEWGMKAERARQAMCESCNTEARSRNQCCRPKAVSHISLRVRVRTCSLTYPARNAYAPYCIVICGLWLHHIFRHIS